MDSTHIYVMIPNIEEFDFDALYEQIGKPGLISDEKFRKAICQLSKKTHKITSAEEIFKIFPKLLYKIISNNEDISYYSDNIHNFIDIKNAMMSFGYTIN